MLAVAKIVGQKDYFGEFVPRVLNESAQDFAQKAVGHAKLLTSRKDPKAVQVDVYEISAINGEQCTRKYGTYHIHPACVRMAEEEFREEQATILEHVPNEFRGALSLLAYENGHSAGYEEVISILGDYVNALEQPILDFEARLKGVKPL